MPAATAKVRDSLIVQKIDGELVVLDRGAGQVHQLNETASFVWEHLDGHTPVEVIAARLCERFEVELPVARGDVAQIIDQFRGADLLEFDQTARTTNDEI